MSIRRRWSVTYRKLPITIAVASMVFAIATLTDNSTRSPTAGAVRVPRHGG